MSATTLANQTNKLEQIEQGNNTITHSTQLVSTYSNEQLISTQNMTIGTWVIVLVGAVYFIKWALN